MEERYVYLIKGFDPYFSDYDDETKEGSQTTLNCDNENDNKNNEGSQSGLKDDKALDPKDQEMDDLMNKSYKELNS